MEKSKEELNIIKPIVLRGIDSLGVDSDNKLYWEDKPIKMQKKISLSF